MPTFLWLVDLEMCLVKADLDDTLVIFQKHTSMCMDADAWPQCQAREQGCRACKKYRIKLLRVDSTVAHSIADTL